MAKALPSYQLSQLAKRDLAGIWSYLVENAGEQIADRMLSTFTGRFETLANNPGMGRPREELQREELQPGLRSFPLKPYVIFYQLISEDTIQIGRILHQRQDLDSAFQS